jgi:pimeloyl-ACP methyl ester carboxylesterase
LDALAVDLPGFGASPPPSQPIGAEGYARLILPVLDEFAKPPVVIGHSFGGRVAVCLAAAHPDRVGPLLLTGSPLLLLAPARKPAFGYRMLRLLHRAGLLGEERMEQIRRRRGSADYRAASGVMRDILVRVINEDYESELRQIRSRVLLLWGEEDREVPPIVAETALRVMRQAGVAAELEILPGVGHLVPLEAPESIRRAVEGVLRP